MTSAGSFWRLVVLPTLGFAAMLGCSAAGKLTGLPLGSQLQPSASSASWDLSSLEWRDWLPQADTATPPATRVSAPVGSRHRDVQWPLR